MQATHKSESHHKMQEIEGCGHANTFLPVPSRLLKGVVVPPPVALLPSCEFSVIGAIRLTDILIDLHVEDMEV